MTRPMAFVDVETTGLNTCADRIVSVSVRAVDEQGRTEAVLDSMVDPGRSPGATHIHRLTAEMLAGAPRFEDLAPQVEELLEGRILVAHHARFDHAMLHAECRRAARELPTTHRLCTVAFARRLDLDVPDHRLATLAAYWGIDQLAPHTSRDDVDVLHRVYLHSADVALRLGVEAPVTPCDGRGAVVYPARVPRVPSPYLNPPAWSVEEPLVQGLKVVITGETRMPRTSLAARLAEYGLDVMNSLSGQTRLLVCNDPTTATVKARSARATGLAVLHEDDVLARLSEVRPGVLRAQAPTGTTAPRRPAPARPWAGRGVLVLGGSAPQAAEARERIAVLGGRALVNLGARTTHALVLDGGESDRRFALVRERGVPLLSLGDLDPAAPVPEAPAETPAVPELGRGHVLDVPAGLDRLSICALWPDAALEPGEEVDVLALRLDVSDRAIGDADVVFYNQPSTPDGEVRLVVDGDREQGVELDLAALAPEVARVRLVAAIDGASAFGAVGPLRVVVRDGDSGVEIAATTLDAATTERTLMLVDVYRRGDTWRLRAVGQGFDHDLAALLRDHGIDVTD
ncbi:TerD family protein [Nocardioides sp.]|uniref:TerD family protein n=1 Tax=Nocardioides sp. TaxID=35761 RepID=UPI003512CBAD